MDINNLVTTINSKCTFVPSLVRQTPDNSKFYTFLHIPKCGGVDFEFSYKKALYSYCHVNKKVFYIDRSDNEESFRNTLKNVNEIQSKGYDCNRIYGILTSHLGIKRLSEEPIIPMDNIITILRNPVDRLISSFSYTCMRANKIPTLDELDRHIALSENINKISFLLDKKSDSNMDDLENSIRDSFFACMDIKDSKFLLGELLSRNNFANVIKENINQTLVKFKLKKEDIPDRILNKIKTLNAKDLDLYERFKANPVTPKFLKSGQLNPQTLLISDDQTQEKSQVSFGIAQTNPLIKFLDKNKANLPNQLGIIIRALKERNIL